MAVQSKMKSDTPILYRPKKKPGEEEPKLTATQALGKAAGQTGAPVYKPQGLASPLLSISSRIAQRALQDGPAQPQQPGVTTAVQAFVPQFNPMDKSTMPGQSTGLTPAWSAPTNQLAGVTPLFRQPQSQPQVQPQPQPQVQSTAQVTGMGELRRYENDFATSYPNAAKKAGEIAEKDYLGGQVWFGSDAGDVAEFKAERRLQTQKAFQPTSQELREVQKWEASGYDAAHIPPRMSPYMARFASISEADRRRYYMTDYPFLKLESKAAAPVTDMSGGGSSSGYSSGGGGRGGGGGGSGSGNGYLPQWFLNMLQWRIS